MISENILFSKVVKITFIFLILADLFFLNFKILSSSTKKQPAAPTVNSFSDTKNIQSDKQQNNINEDRLTAAETVNICKNLISKSIASISSVIMVSPVPRQSVKPVYQSVPQDRPEIVYVPLGGSISAKNRDWGYTGGAEAYFNMADYQTAKKISFEAFLKIKDSNGQANTRLYDATNQVVIADSEIWGGGEAVMLQFSPPLQLLSGNNLLQVQLRSTTGYEAFLESPRLKIEFK